MSETTDAVRPGRIPKWMRRPIQTDVDYAETQATLKKNGLHTVCEDAKCPNRHECWNHGTATIMILGNVCTRDCRFCSIATGKPEGLDLGEPLRVAEAVETMKLKHVVITSVTRDDMLDGGAEIFAQTITAIKERVPGLTVEVLTPDFWGRKEPLYKVLDAGPLVFNHNVETVRRLQRSIRSGATYERSLSILKMASEYGDGSIKVKTGIMLGLGETNEEVMECLQDIYEHGVRLLTIGQYMAPTRDHAHTKRFVTPKEFADFEEAAYKIGFDAVASGPLVRSSYRADKMVSA
ncbi:lipoyl synthase [Pontiella sulfatireligans]|uniref:Lipoyl synthase n=1 Tax=Pontiella sulfatireligans TaxID=2750658 RepID=A0A6C2UMN9_9BACT|nr:lipoyl synthase [Pontiella sulfatireligans]VGO21193.1 Lipoyl synthase [Pontiella sulfatireligans]